MKRIGIFLFMLLLSLAAAAQVRIIQHTVTSGETLYSLSKKYAVTAEQIVAQNPGLTAETLKAGSTIAIPTALPGNNGTPTTGKGPLPTQSGCKEMHKVEKGETLWSISQKYGITVDELIQANPPMREDGYKLKKGKTVCIPYAQRPEEKAAENLPQNLRIGVLLPLTAETPEAKRCLEFYRGLLMAVADFKYQGKNITVITYDEPASNASVYTVLNKLESQPVDFLVGPLYLEHFSDVSAFSQRTKTKVIVPFSSKMEQVAYNPHLFLVNSPEAEKQQYAIDLFAKTFPTANLLILKTEKGNKSDFANRLSKKWTEKKLNVAGLPLGASGKQLKSQMKSGKLTVLVPDDSEEKTLATVLADIRKFKEEYPEQNIALYGYDEWLSLVPKYQEALFQADTYISTHYFYNTGSAETQRFNQRYHDWFNTAPLDFTPQMGLQGYDFARQLMSNYFSYGKLVTGKAAAVAGIQTDIRFDRQGKEGGYVNKNLLLLHFKKNRTLDKISNK